MAWSATHTDAQKVWVGRGRRTVVSLLPPPREPLFPASLPRSTAFGKFVSVKDDELVFPLMNQNHICQPGLG